MAQMFYDHFDTDLIGMLTLVADEQGLRHITFENARRPVTVQPSWQHDPTFFVETKSQLSAYLNNETRYFDLSLAPIGTPFQQAVWQALLKIPYGEVRSYRWVAERIGNPKAVRAVGGANARNPLPVVIPCHRVIGANGSLTGFGGGLDVKQTLIDLEK